MSIQRFRGYKEPSSFVCREYLMGSNLSEQMYLYLKEGKGKQSSSIAGKKYNKEKIL